MNSHEVWQVEVQGHVYEANIDEIIEWINEGSVLPADKVRKGSLRWLKAERVPELYAHFKANNFYNDSTVNLTLTDANSSAKAPITDPKELEMLQSFSAETEKPSSSNPETVNKEKSSPIDGTPSAETPPNSTGMCSVHTDLEAQYFCGTCLTLFCKTCPESFGGNVKICTLCGAMCRIYTGQESLVKSVGAINKPYPRAELEINNAANLTQGDFCLGDFGRALIYPFKFKTSLIIGAILFMLFALGQTVSAFGISMYFAAVICLMLANMLTFGCLANTLENFSEGKTGSNFMPNFDEFALWDDVIHPFLLSFGVYFISFGLFLVFLGGAFWYASGSEEKIQADKQKILSVVLPNESNAANLSEQTLQINQLTNAPNSDSAANENSTLADENARLEQKSINAKLELQRLKKEIQQSVQARLETRNAENKESEIGIFNQTVGTVMRLSLVFSVPIFLALIWGIFYFPAACVIAGYTRSFKAIVNPSIGFDTIKRLGMNYAKIIGVFLVLAVTVFGLNAILQMLFAPLDLPYLGNLPVKAIVSLFIFYVSIVFSVILGITLFRNSTKLNFRAN